MHACVHVCMCAWQFMQKVLPGTVLSIGDRIPQCNTATGGLYILVPNLKKEVAAVGAGVKYTTINTRASGEDKNLLSKL